MKHIICICALAFGCVGSATAQSVTYQQWRNASTGAMACAVESPGPQWQRHSGPFSEKTCTIAVPV